ncbi:MAG: HNH endonuclease family protein [Corynebacterium sp.]|nr:HNH endonuclease family protein [Corynebacterium sp.]
MARRGASKSTSHTILLLIVVLGLIAIGGLLNTEYFEESEFSRGDDTTFAPHQDGEIVAITQANGEVLAELVLQDYVVEIAPYDRDAFGQAWSDNVDVEFGHNGCDTRNDILSRDLTNIVYRENTNDCVVLSGDFVDVYSFDAFRFERGQQTSSLVQIDHVVPLADAWYSGAHAWDADTRRNFANDPINLQAVTSHQNQSKKALTADRWLPENVQYWCTYVTRQAIIKRDYNLTVTQAEAAKFNEILASC